MMTSLLFVLGTLFIFSYPFFIFQFAIFCCVFIRQGFKLEKSSIFFIAISAISLMIHLYMGSVNKIYLFTSVCCLLAATVPSLYEYCNAKIENIKWERLINASIYFHIVTFLIQYISFKVFHIDIDYGKLLLGPPHRSSYNGFDYRATGVFAEPSIFAAHMICLLVMKYVIARSNSLLTYVALFCMVLSGSTVSVLSVLAYFIITIRFTLKWLKSDLLPFLFLIPSILGNLFWRGAYISSGNDGSTTFKIDLIKSFFNESSIFNIGYGMVGYYKGAPEYLQSIFDITVFGSSLIVFGFWFGAFVSLVWMSVFYKVSKISIRLSILCLLPCLKLTFLFPIFWLYLKFLTEYVRKNDE